MTIRVKIGAEGGGYWHPVSNGYMRLKWGGWYSPGYARVKIGDLGGGYWYDTGYRGIPYPPPGNVHVYDWPSYSSIRCSWGGPGPGGGPVVSYDVKMTDSGGVNVLAYYEAVAGPPSPWFNVGEDWMVAFFVRSRGVGGQVSDWSQGWYLNPAAGDYRLSSRAIMGHSEQGYYSDVVRTRGWTSAVASGARRNGVPFYCWATSASCYVSNIVWHNLRTQQGNIIAPQWNEWGPMTIYWAGNASWGPGQWGQPITDYFGHIWSGDNRDWNIGGGGGYHMNNWWGLVPSGTGWSSWDDPAHMLYADAVYVYGWENYNERVYNLTRAKADNNYW